jgi:hypothetical protein
MERTVSGYLFLGIYELEKIVGITKVLGKRCGSVESSTYAATMKRICRKWHEEIKVFT